VSQVYKLPVQECSKYITCSRCLAAADPYCGWCVMQARYVDVHHFLLVWVWRRLKVKPLRYRYLTHLCLCATVKRSEKLWRFSAVVKSYANWPQTVIVAVYCSCTMQSECSNAGVNNHWKSRLTGNYNSCVNITNIQPASEWPIQHSVNVRYSTCNSW